MKFMQLSFLLFFIIGCVPLEQAPLIYTSTVTYGATTSVNGVETPGVSVVIGYKLVDAAYVPVAVSKRGDSNDLKLVTGTQTGEKLRTFDNPEQRDKYNELNDQLTLFNLKFKKSESERVDLIKKKSNAEKELKELKELKEFKDNAEANNNESDRRLKSEIQKLTSEIASKDKSTKELRDEIITVERKIKEVIGEGNALYADISSEGLASKTDAYSVYGSFNGKNTVGKKSNNIEAGNSLGKVFSTGIAAQTLALAERDRARAIGVEECLGKLVQLLEKSKEKLQLSESSVLSLCESKVVDTDLEGQ